MNSLLKKTTLFLLLSIASSAEDVCPINFQFYDAETPQWLDREAILNKLKSKASQKGQDPLLEKLIEYTNQQDCSKGELKSTSFELEQSIHENGFINGKSFNCKNLANKLTTIQELKEGDVVMIRGSRRVLFGHIGESSFCVQSSNFDGSRLNDENIQTLYERLFGNYIIKKIDEQNQ